MAPKYKLTYFNLTGLGEPIRYIFAYGNVEYEDHRIEFADWPAIKGNTPFGQLPLLEVNGEQVFQSSAICRYLAREIGGLTGKSNWEALQADVVVDTLTDFRLNYTAYFREQNEEAKAKKLEDIKNVHNPFYLSKFEELVKKNGGHFVNGQLTWADIYFAALSDLLSNVAKVPILTDYPSLAALKEKVDNIPSIKAHREKRPQTL